MSEVLAGGWPETAFDAPLLRGLDDPSRRALMSAAFRRAYAGEETIYSARQAGDSFFIVHRGRVGLFTVLRGEHAKRLIRTVVRGDAFGAEVSLPGSLRELDAVAVEPCEVLEIPVPLFLRLTTRSAATRELDRERRIMQRRAVRDLLESLSLARELSPAELDTFLDAAEGELHAAGESIYVSGQRALDARLVLSGLVQLQVEGERGVRVRAYLSRGDFVGDAECLAGSDFESNAVAMGPARTLKISARVLLDLCSRNPAFAARLANVAGDRASLQSAVIGEAQDRSTQHAFVDLHRMQAARSLLTIDLDTCVRCGHCAWTCENVHGVAKIVRRGEKVVTRLKVLHEGEVPRSLLLPSSCQHCENPVCMIDCPTGAIGRDASGEVFIKEELCTGCGNCAKACPWENIRMSERKAPFRIAPSLSEGKTSAQLAQLYPDVATKCDLCRGYEAPACVQSCPTNSLWRVEPKRDFVEVSAVLGIDTHAADAPEAIRVVRPFAASYGVLPLAVALGIVATLAARAGIVRSGSGVGFAAGVLGALTMLALVAYAIPKRFPRLWMTPRAQGGTDRGVTRFTKSRLAPWLRMHALLGMLGALFVLAHTGGRLSSGIAGALSWAFWLSALSGGLGAFIYRRVPVALSKLERAGSLPEDLIDAQTHLLERFHKHLSGTSEALKTIATRVLTPYARDRFGPLTLLASGRALRDERHALLEHVASLRRHGLLVEAHEQQALEDLARDSVELRALPLRRFLTSALRGVLPVHMIVSALSLLLLLLHVLTAGQ